ncbi:carboxypeptidase-like regulatory domain-containing protein [Zavarzinia sp.]|uniref:carboxypeptidase-like regulatory domain-containing protein n=1 Tax=Zavarzinia sp. TaxID=2027920 RepID=UPI003569170A
MIARLLLAFACLLAFTAPAAAHRLKLFATVEEGAITGYAFFIGGGRPEGAELIVHDAAGQEIFRTATDAQGGFAWTPPKPDDYRLTVDARDGHMAEATIGADRLGGVAAPAPASAPTPAPAAPADTAAIERAVDKAVERQIRPLLEAYAEAEGRIRFNDVMGGIGMIVGLAGIGLWAAARRKSRDG